VVNKSLYNDKTYRREIARYEDSVNRASYQLIKSKDSAKREAFLVIDRLEDSISSLNSQLAEGDAESTQIQTTNNEKIKYINRLSTDSLAVFFTRRYAKN
jgi:hypothetical protein